MDTSMPENTVLLAKLAEAQLPGHTVEFDPVEAEQVGPKGRLGLPKARATERIERVISYSTLRRLERNGRCPSDGRRYCPSVTMLTSLRRIGWKAAWWAEVTGGRDDE